MGLDIEQDGLTADSNSMRFAALLPFGNPKLSSDWDKVVNSFAVVPFTES
jgi:hypothetical protein